ncbi:hypothetical protein HPG69_018120, partial [Diceros bicornis minor]
MKPGRSTSPVREITTVEPGAESQPAQSGRHVLSGSQMQTQNQMEVCTKDRSPAMRGGTMANGMKLAFKAKPGYGV